MIVEAPVADVEPPVPRPPPVVLTGACVDPIADATKRSPHHIAPVMEPERIDLDGDDAPDWIVTTDADAQAYRGYVYITRGACAHFVGSWVGSSPRPASTSTRGLPDLESGSPCKKHCCPSETVRILKFDGHVYKKAGERTDTRDCSPARPF